MTTCDVCGNWIHGRLVCTDENDEPICAQCMDEAREAGGLMQLGNDGEYHPLSPDAPADPKGTEK